uniref:Glycosyltransferase n=1 Tax=candidate division WOR-3 bacterium TaxID=2052148 RepID=A0A7C6A8W1_UNCW3
MELSVIIINFGMEDKVIVCIESLLETQRRVDYEIIVVNKPNPRSQIDCLKQFRGQFALGGLPPIRLINYNQFGVGKMRNIGIKNALGEYLLMLDADTEVVDDLSDLLTFIRNHPLCGAVGVKLLTPDGNLQYSCRTFYDLRTVIFRRTFLSKLLPNHRIQRQHLMMDFDHNDVRRVDWVQGAFLLMRRQAIADVGLFDEFSPFGLEDVSWCWRAHKRGWHIYYFPQVRVIHHYQRSSYSIKSKRFFEHLLAFLKFIFKYGLPKV